MSDQNYEKDHGVVDQARVMHLAELTLEFCDEHLKPGGNLLVKVFQGEGFMELRKAMQAMFGTVALRKPAASRNRSAEIYLLARGKNRNKVTAAIARELTGFVWRVFQIMAARMRPQTTVVRG